VELARTPVRGWPPRRRRATSLPWLLLCACAVMVFGFLMLPTLVVIPVSFSSSQYLQFPPPGFSLQWYQRYLGSPVWLQATFLSFKIAITTAALATVLGTMAAFGIVRGRYRGKMLVSTMLLAPLVIPTIIIAIGVYDWYSQLRLIGSWVGIAIAHTMLALPLVLTIVGAALRTLDPTLEQAALGLGANHLRVIWHITLALIQPAMVASALFAFVLSFDELIVAMFIGGVNMTLPKRMFDNIRVEIDPTIAPISTLLIVISCLMLYGVQHVTRAYRRNP